MVGLLSDKGKGLTREIIVIHKIRERETHYQIESKEVNWPLNLIPTETK
jgi:hypothetical protein